MPRLNSERGEIPRLINRVDEPVGLGPGMALREPSAHDRSIAGAGEAGTL